MTLAEFKAGKLLTYKSVTGTTIYARVCIQGGVQKLVQNSFEGPSMTTVNVEADDDMLAKLLALAA